MVTSSCSSHSLAGRCLKRGNSFPSALPRIHLVVRYTTFQEESDHLGFAWKSCAFKHLEQLSLTVGSVCERSSLLACVATACRPEPTPTVAGRLDRCETSQHPSRGHLCMVHHPNAAPCPKMSTVVPKRTAT